MIASIIAAFMVATNPAASTCATVNNASNTATWLARDGRRVVATYTDAGGSALRYSRSVPVQVRQAEAALQVGRQGKKSITVCS